MKDFRCGKCNKLLGRYRECRVLEIKCPRCGQKNTLQSTSRILPHSRNPTLFTEDRPPGSTLSL
ncbi:MAG: Com family DNA-binding transcriptional regulator [Firmicutes bacterium]|nr:Com family DNA-binding transcriptional regulator [Bacillota bacterium]